MDGSKFGLAVLAVAKNKLVTGDGEEINLLLCPGRGPIEVENVFLRFLVMALFSEEVP